MREITISEFLSTIEKLHAQYPFARVDFVFPKRHGDKQRSALGSITEMGVLLDSYEASKATVRFTIDYARGPLLHTWEELEPAIKAYGAGEISIGRVRELFQQWTDGKPIKISLPTTSDN